VLILILIPLVVMLSLSLPMGVTEIRAEDFPLPVFRQRIDDIVDRLEHGLGLMLLRGLPVYDRFSVDEATRIYCSIQTPPTSRA
jgi:hypothetical protein